MSVDPLKDIGVRSVRDRDWVDIGGTAAVILALFGLMCAGLWVIDRHLERRADRQAECLAHSWIWYEGQCVPAWVPDSTP